MHKVAQAPLADKDTAEVRRVLHRQRVDTLPPPREEELSGEDPPAAFSPGDRTESERVADPASKDQTSRCLQDREGAHPSAE